jgi:hypothetical protein
MYLNIKQKYSDTKINKNLTIIDGFSSFNNQNFIIKSDSVSYKDNTWFFGLFLKEEGVSLENFTHISSSDGRLSFISFFVVYFFGLVFEFLNNLLYFGYLFSLICLEFLVLLPGKLILIKNHLKVFIRSVTDKKVYRFWIPT